MISPVFWTLDQRFSFQYVDGYYRVYGETGDFLIELKTPEKTFEYISEADSKLQAEKLKNYLEEDDIADGIGQTFSPD